MKHVKIAFSTKRGDFDFRIAESGEEPVDFSLTPMETIRMIQQLRYEVDLILGGEPPSPPILRVVRKGGE